MSYKCIPQTVFSGTGFKVHITLRQSNLSPLYQGVDHSDSNDNDDFYGDIGITEDYCKYPVPEKYKLSVKTHWVSCFVMRLYMYLLLLNLRLFLNNSYPFILLFNYAAHTYNDRKTFVILTVIV